MPPEPGFAIWITGLPASGKSSLTRRLVALLARLGVATEVLESDRLREQLTPQPTYTPAERELFYRALAFFGSRLAAHGVNVIFDATANRRTYRDLARGGCERFVEVAVDCPLEVCRARDRKGTYQKGLDGRSQTVPGLGDAYEPPLHPDVVVHSDRESLEAGAERVLGVLRQRGYLPG